jgi:hypothetical protein
MIQAPRESGMSLLLAASTKTEIVWAMLEQAVLTSSSALRQKSGERAVDWSPRVWSTKT